MWCSDLVTPVTSSDGDDGELGKNDGATNSGCDFFRALDTETDVTFAVADDDDGLEASTLTSTGLFLDWHNLQDFIFEIGQELVDDFSLLEDQRARRTRRESVEL